MSAPERIPARRVSARDRAALDLLARGELKVEGQIRDASNAVLLCTVTLDGHTATCVYKPVRGERPLWDFPDGTLAQREVAAYEIAEALGWPLVPPTVLRDGPYGQGMCQLWIDGPDVNGQDGQEGQDGEHSEDGASGEAAEQGGAGRLLALVDGDEPGEGWKAVGFAEVGEGRTALLVHADDARLRRLAVLDAVINNGDRKGGHLLVDAEGRLYGIDHGVCFHTDDKLRTLLWGWAGEPLTEEATGALEALRDALADGEPLAARMAELITEAELTAVRERVAALLKTGRHPRPSGEWPAIPWPPV
ncbi:SCO1664 family protein [Streptomyces beihaiensis]|uniref:SCO1664 family protein n=1 Tax=Streptomyces beihaiensis TaxID=2984495 RepID=A0ABT3TR16_9ACTN|nr:SCO1664 family protein [Streptomyces beihaiensis]MCX3059489.1 SCO1664 family protein [Streptomyces beihaiensis]